MNLIGGLALSSDMYFLSNIEENLEVSHNTVLSKDIKSGLSCPQ